MEHKFYVIRFAELPSNYVDNYVCVPRSWIKIHISEEREVIVAYPVEEAHKTKERIKNGEPLNKDWKHYWGFVEYSSDDYLDAELWITSGAVDRNDKTNPGYTYNGNPSGQAAEIETYSCQQTTCNANKSQTKDVSMTNHPIPSIKLSLKRNLQSNKADEFYIKRLRIDKPTDREQKTPDYLSKPAANPRQTHQDNSNPETRTQGIIETAPITTYPTGSPQTAMVSTAQTASNSANQSYQPTVNLLENCGQQKVDTGRPASANCSSENTYIDSTNTSLRNSANQTDPTSENSYQKRISVVPNEYLFQNHGEQEVANERSWSGTINAQYVMQTSTNPLNQAYQSPEYQKHIQVSPNDYLPQDHEKSQINPDGRSINPNLTRNVSFAAPVLKTLMTQNIEPRNRQEKESLAINNNILHQEPFIQSLLNRPNEVYQNGKIISKSPTTPNVMQSALTKSAQQLHLKDHSTPNLNLAHNLHKNNIYKHNLSEITNQSCQLAEQSHLRHDASGCNVHVHINKIVVARSTDVDCDDRIESSQGVTKRTVSNVLNTQSIVTNSSGLHEKSPQDQDLSGYKVIVQQDPLVNKIIITKSTEMEKERRNSVNVSESSKSSHGSHEKKISAALPECSEKNSGPRKVVRTTTAGIPYIVNDYFPENVKTAPSTNVHCPNIEKQFSHLSKPSNSLSRRVSQNYPAQVPHTERTVGKMVTTDRIDQKPRLQSIRKHKLMSTQDSQSIPENILGQFNERLHRKPSVPICNEHLMQDRGTRVQYVRQPTNMNRYEQSAYFQNARRHQHQMQKPPNRMGHPIQVVDRLHERQFAPVQSNYLHQEPHRQQNHFLRPTIANTINQRPQIMSQNTSSMRNISAMQNTPVMQNSSAMQSSSTVQNSSGMQSSSAIQNTLIRDNYANPANYSCKCLNQKHLAPVIQDQSYEQPRIEQTFVRRSAEGCNKKHMVHQQTNTDNVRLINERYVNTANQSMATFANPIQDCYIPDLVEPLAGEILSQEIPAVIYTNESCIGNSINSENNAQDRRFDVCKSPNLNNTSLGYPVRNYFSPTRSPVYKLGSDQEMRSEEINIDETFIEDSNDANCIKQNIYSTPKQDVTNINNGSNPKLITEHAFINDLNSICRKMDTNICKTYTLIDNANKIFVEYADSFQKTMKIVNDYYELNINNTASSTSMHAKKAKDKRHKKKRLDKYRYDGNDDEDHSNNI